MQDRPAQLAAGGPDPQANVIIGQANFGKFRLILWDETGRNPKPFPEQTNVDNVPDLVSLGPVAALNRKILSWEVIVAPFPSGQGQLYSVTIEVTQGGVVVPDGKVVDSGALDGGAKLVFGGLRLIAV